MSIDTDSDLTRERERESLISKSPIESDADSTMEREKTDRETLSDSDSFMERERDFGC